MRELIISRLGDLSDGYLSSHSVLTLREEEVTCANLGNLTKLISQATLGVVIEMPEAQLVKGDRGWAKAKILQMLDSDKVEMIIAVPNSSSNRLTESTGKIVHSERVHDPYIGVTTSEEDRDFLEKAKQLEADSNCGYIPTSSIYVRDGKTILTGVSHNLNGSGCKQLDLSSANLELNPGVRLMFCDAQHSERSAIAEAARSGIRLDGSTLYNNRFPCRDCMKSVIEAGVKRIVFRDDSYGLPDLDLLRHNGIEVARFVNL